MTLQAQIKWVTNLADFKREIEQGTTGIVAHTAKVDQLTRSLSGNGLLGAANNYVAAVEKMGGVEKLTAAEKERINGLVTKAIEKYDALGREAPDAMRRLEEATRKVEKPTETWGTQLNKVLGAVGISVGIGTIVSLGRDILQMGDDIVKTSDRTGLLTDEVQKLSYIGGQSGNTIEELTGAISSMQNRLASGDDSAIAALKRLNVNFEDLRKAGPYQQLEMIAEAVGKVQNPATQAQLAIDLFGRTGAAILPTLKSQFKALGDQAPLMSENTIRALDQAGDAWGQFALAIKVKLAEGYNELGRQFDRWVAGFYRGLAEVTTGVAKLAGLAEKVPGASKIIGGSADYFTKQAQFFTDAANLMEQGTNKAASSARAAAPAFEVVGKKNDEAAKAAAAHAKQLQTINDKLLGNGAIRAAQDYVKAIGPLANVHKMNADHQAEVNKVMGEAIEAYRLQGKVAPQAVRDLYVETMKLPQLVHLTGDEIGKLGEHFKATVPPMVSIAELAPKLVLGFEGVANIGNRFDVTIPKIEKQATAWEHTYSALGDVSTILDNIPGKFSEIASVAARTGQAIMKNLADGNVWGAIVAGATGVIQVFSKLFGSAGRDEVEKFAKTFADATDRGGFDNLHAKLLTLGAAGEALWIKLTQGVGRNNPEQARKVIEEINAALGAQDAWMQRLPGLIEKYGLSWEDAGAKAKQAHLDEIARGLIQDFADLSKAGFDVTLITEKMGTAINDYVHLAMRTGTEVPAAMKPLLEKMLEMGTLTDDAGVKLDDLSGITFSTTLTEGFKSVVEAIKELTKALTGDLGGALDTLGKRGPVVIPIRFEREDPTGAAEAERYHQGTARVLPFRGIVAHHGLLPDEVPAILQTGEAVLNRRAAAAVGTPAIAALNRGERPARNDARVDELRRELAAQRAASDANFERLMTLLPKLVKAAAQQGKVA